MPLTPDLLEQAEKIIRTYASAGKKIVTAESCTGGLLATALTEIPGASAVFERGFVSYSNDSKIDLLGVDPDLLNAHGAVSDEVAESMASGAIDYSLADVAISITGVAGPDGSTASKPVGLVFFGVATKHGAKFHQRCHFEGNRDSIRTKSVAEALKLLDAALSEEKK